MADASKIIISNLPNDVTEAAVRDLMQSTVGPVRTVQMSYTAAGKSTGVATVLFKNKGDANKAHSTCTFWIASVLASPSAIIPQFHHRWR